MTSPHLQMEKDSLSFLPKCRFIFFHTQHVNQMLHAHSKHSGVKTKHCENKRMRPRTTAIGLVYVCVLLWSWK